MEGVLRIFQGTDDDRLPPESMRLFLTNVSKNDVSYLLENGTLTIALNRTTFEYEVQMRFVCSLNRASVEQLAVDLVVQFGRELLAPAVEAEVEQAVMPLVVGEGDESVIAGPSVVRIDN